jgi:hypothetical protein
MLGTPIGRSDAGRESVEEMLAEVGAVKRDKRAAASRDDGSS